MLQCCPGYVDTDMTSHKGLKTIDEGTMSDQLLVEPNTVIIVSYGTAVLKLSQL